ncbi:uncharacterized protein SOCEGT47_048020 [Sorangium cellulosum]|uniref:Uncharacterized protein n=1 Tax=Sorangium cellulosum TaxID=56 RepID=A0A4P2Q4H2_SORCE|nr:uncharacterized protein SOCEGT47_048020 [Sorangium cellulosum]
MLRHDLEEAVAQGRGLDGVRLGVALVAGRRERGPGHPLGAAPLGVMLTWVMSRCDP